jgi:hypothetical protein
MLRISGAGAEGGIAKGYGVGGLAIGAGGAAPGAPSSAATTRGGGGEGGGDRGRGDERRELGDWATTACAGAAVGPAGGRVACVTALAAGHWLGG